jgi:hypothetical protein
MTTKLSLFGLGLLLVLAAGCATDKTPIVFLSQPQIPQYMTADAAVAKGISKDDEQKIDVLVFTYMLNKHPWNDGDYAAIFLQADDSVVDAMIYKFPKRNPPIKRGDRLDLHSAQTPVDRDTGLPVLILGVDVQDPGADGSVVASGRWYAGSDVKGYFTFTLKKAGDDWTMLSVK